MIDILIKTARSVAGNAYDQFVSSVYAQLIENLILVRGKNRLELIDVEGKSCIVSRYREYAIRWSAVDYLPLERISVGPTGTVKSFSITHPKGIDP